MSAVLGSLIAVAGTLLGSFSGYLFQRRTAERAAIAARNERLWQERLAACGGFASAVTDLKRGVIAAWFLRSRRDQAPADYQQARADADRLGAVAQSAAFRMRLVTDNAELHRQADAAFSCVDPIWDAADLTELKAREAEFDAAVAAFVSAASRFLA